MALTSIFRNYYNNFTLIRYSLSMDGEEPKRNWWIWLIVFLFVAAIIYGLIQFVVLARGRRAAAPEPTPTVEPTEEPLPTQVPTATPTPEIVSPTQVPPLRLPKTGVE